MAGREGISRGKFIAGVAGTGGVLVAGGIVGAELLSGQSGSSLGDASPLALALALEQLQSAFYAEALAGGALEGELLDFATTARDHEAQHASALVPLVGTGAVEEPTYAFGASVTDPDEFATTSATLEDLAVSAYNGLIPGLSERGLAIASRIVSVDARHAAWIRAIIGRDPAQEATDPSLTADQIVKQVEDLGFIQEATP